MSDIILHQFAPDPGAESGSPFCVKVHRALAFKGVAYTPRAVASPGEIRRVNPGAGKVPVLEVDGRFIPDSTHIIDWLEEHKPEPALRPIDPRQRALDRLLEDWADEGLYWYAVYMRWQVDSNFGPFARRTFAGLPPVVRGIVPGIVRRGVVKQLRGQGLGRLPLDRVLAELDGRLDMIEELLGDGPWLLGGQLAACDLAVFGPLRQLAVPAHPESAGLIGKRDALLAWLARVDEATANEHTVAFGS